MAEPTPHRATHRHLHARDGHADDLRDRAQHDSPLLLALTRLRLVPLRRRPQPRFSGASIVIEMAAEIGALRSEKTAFIPSSYGPVATYPVSH